MTMSFWAFVILIACPMLIALTLILAGAALDKKDRKRRGETDYDERQQYHRGKAYQYAFWVLALYVGIWCVLDAFADWPWLYVVWNVGGGGLALALAVFGVYCIVHDAYQGWKAQNQLGWAACFLVVGALNIVTWLIGDLERGILLRLFLGADFVMMGLTAILHDRRQRRREAEER